LIPVARLKLVFISDDSNHISPKTLWHFRSIVTENELDTLLLNQITDKLAKVFSVNTDKQRIDSVHITSNMRRLGCISIFARSIRPSLVNLRQPHRELFNARFDAMVKSFILIFLQETAGLVLLIADCLFLEHS
jgi:hypothetical protein